jgi:hypothetical protein
MKAFWKEPDTSTSFRETSNGTYQTAPSTQQTLDAGQWSSYVTNKWKDRRPQTVSSEYATADKIRKGERLNPPKRDPENSMMYGISKQRIVNESLDVGELIVPGGNRKKRIRIPGMAPTGSDPQFSFCSSAKPDRFKTSLGASQTKLHTVTRPQLASYRQQTKLAAGLLA